MAATVYRLEYQMHIGNGPRKGNYEQLGGYTMSEAKKAAWLAENPSNSVSTQLVCDWDDFDISDLDRDEHAAYDAAF